MEQLQDPSFFSFFPRMFVFGRRRATTSTEPVTDAELYVICLLTIFYDVT